MSFNKNYELVAPVAIPENIIRHDLVKLEPVSEPIDNQSRLETLKGELSTLSKHFQDQCIFSEEALKQRKATARGQHKDFVTVIEPSLHSLMITVQQRLGEGFYFEYHPYSCHVGDNAEVFSVQLKKPDFQLSEEYVGVDASAEEQYAKDREEAKPRLIAEITQVRLLINELEELIKTEAKKESAYQRELAKVQRELLGNVTQ
jgi:hypothetical protein